MQFDRRTATIYLHTRSRGSRQHKLWAMPADGWERARGSHEDCKCKSAVACLRHQLEAAGAVVVLEWADGARYLPPALCALPYRAFEACGDAPLAI